MTGPYTSGLGAVIAAAVIAIAGIGVTIAKGGQDMIRLFYVPIGMETLKPVTAENIETRGRPCSIKDAAIADEIKKVLSEARPPVDPEQRFSNKTVRVKIPDGITKSGERIWWIVENDGRARIGSEDRVLSHDGLMRLKRAIEGSCP
jgi:hypothetical protein